MAKGVFGSGAFKGLDAFGKTLEEAKVKTRTGGFLTILSAALILTFSMIEFVDYRRVNLDTSIIVDRSRGEKLNVVFNITFPKIPCYLVSLDVTDISGDVQTDIHHNIQKVRLTPAGVRAGEAVAGAPIVSNEMQSDLDKAAKAKGPDYCGSCYGGIPPENGCCNSCEDVREAYVNKGWSFANPDAIEQCISEHWTETIKAQSEEGCNIGGRIKSNKVAGNLMFSPGRSFMTTGMNFRDLVPYLKEGGVTHHWGHQINHFGFESVEEEYKPKERQKMKEKLGNQADPLDGHWGFAKNDEFMFQYFLKVVGNRYYFLNSKRISTHQYSVTTYDRDLTQSNVAKNAQGIMQARGTQGQPGAFFNFDVSPMLVVHTETRQSFAHFLTSACAIIGGVLTIASLVDSFVFQAQKSIKFTGSSNGKSL